jgi:pimeloyl-ACP methyl ester carboxylesterase
MTAPRAEPIFFGPEERPLFGWVHRPKPGRERDLGLVITSPFGYEAICAHRALRHFAEAAAGHGVPALRFDLDGAGDSAGGDRDPDRLRAWVESVHRAVVALREETGVARVCLLGVRLGALIAALSAVERDDIAGFVAIAPVVSGKAYLRELRMMEKSREMPAPPGTPEEEGVEGAIGFALTTETRAKLGAVDLVKLEKRPAGEVLLLDRADLPGNDRLPRRLEALGAKVSEASLPGYLEMVADPHNTRVPREMINAAVAWLTERSQPAERREPGDAARASFTLARLPQVEESAVSFGRDRALFGIVSAPAGEARGRRKGILLLNAGSIHHVGPNRLYVELARRWAERHVVLRFDVSGIGDSRTHAGEGENVTYTPRANEDIEAAIAHLRARGDVDEVHAVGLCSGAYNAFKAAVAGVRLDGLVMINPLTFFWKAGMPLDYIAPYMVEKESTRYLGRVRNLEAWKKLLRGEVKIRPAAEIVARRAASIAARYARDVARRVGRPFPEDLGAELESVARRGVGMLFIFAGSDPGLGLLHTQGGSSVPRLRSRGHLEIRIVDGCDHTFTPLWSQPRLAALLTEHLGA